MQSSSAVLGASEACSWVGADYGTTCTEDYCATSSPPPVAAGLWRLVTVVATTCGHSHSLEGCLLGLGAGPAALGSLPQTLASNGKQGSETAPLVTPESAWLCSRGLMPLSTQGGATICARGGQRSGSCSGACYGRSPGNAPTYLDAAGPWSSCQRRCSGGTGY